MPRISHLKTKVLLPTLSQKGSPKNKSRNYKSRNKIDFLSFHIKTYTIG